VETSGQRWLVERDVRALSSATPTRSTRRHDFLRPIYTARASGSGRVVPRRLVPAHVTAPAVAPAPTAQRPPPLKPDPAPAVPAATPAAPRRWRAAPRCRAGATQRVHETNAPRGAAGDRPPVLRARGPGSREHGVSRSRYRPRPARPAPCPAKCSIDQRVRHHTTCGAPPLAGKVAFTHIAGTRGQAVLAPPRENNHYPRGRTARRPWSSEPVTFGSRSTSPARRGRRGRAAIKQASQVTLASRAATRKSSAVLRAGKLTADDLPVHGQ